MFSTFLSFFRLFVHLPLPTSLSLIPTITIPVFLSRNGGVKLQKDGSEMAAENTGKESSRSGDNLVASKKDV